MVTTTQNLAELQEASTRHLGRWVERGNRLTQWTCPSCKTPNDCKRPNEDDIAPGRLCWSSLTTCVYCGVISMVLTFPSGQTQTRTID